LPRTAECQMTRALGAMPPDPPRLSLRAKRGNLIASPPRLLRRLQLLAKTGEKCHCEESRQGGTTWQSHSSSYRSCHCGFMPLIRSSFFCLDPALSCFSLRIAPSASSQTS